MVFIKTKKYLIFSCSEEIASYNLEEVKIMPTGLVKSQKGDFIVDEESVKLMLEHFKSRELDLVIDYEHQTLTGEIALAGGWVKDFYIKDEAVVAKVEWTKQAKEQIESKQYKYLSPVVLVRKSDNKAVRLHSVALTNTPAIDGMYQLVNSLDVDELIEENGGNKMLEKLLEILDLDKNSSEDNVFEKIKELIENAQANNTNEELVANKQVLEMLDLKEGSTVKEVTEKITELKKPAGISSEEFNELKLKFEQKEVDELITNALKDGKLLPYQVDEYKKLALKDKELFNSILDKTPKTVPIGEEFYNSINKDKKSVNLDDISMKICKSLGVSVDDLKTYGGDING